MLPGNAPREDLHFLHRLLVALALGGGDAVTIGRERFIVALFGGQCLAESWRRLTS